MFTYISVMFVDNVPKEILRDLLNPHLLTDSLDVVPILAHFTTELRESLARYARDPAVVGFKSIVCYRTGLDVSTYCSQAGLKFSLLDVFKMLQTKAKIRLAHKDLNDLVVKVAVEVAGEYQRPSESLVYHLTGRVDFKYHQFSFIRVSVTVTLISLIQTLLDCNKLFETILVPLSCCYIHHIHILARQDTWLRFTQTYTWILARYGVIEFQE